MQLQPLNSRLQSAIDTRHRPDDLQEVTRSLTMAVAFPPHIMALSKVQRLYDACDVVFSSPAAAPTVGEIRWLQNILGQFTTFCRAYALLRLHFFFLHTSWCSPAGE